MIDSSCSNFLQVICYCGIRYPFKWGSNFQALFLLIWFVLISYPSGIYNLVPFKDERTVTTRTFAIINPVTNWYSRSLLCSSCIAKWQHRSCPFSVYIFLQLWTSRPGLCPFWALIERPTERIQFRYVTITRTLSLYFEARIECYLRPIVIQGSKLEK